jgi:hypothetical protein
VLLVVLAVVLLVVLAVVVLVVVLVVVHLASVRDVALPRNRCCRFGNSGGLLRA